MTPASSVCVVTLGTDTGQAGEWWMQSNVDALGQEFKEVDWLYKSMILGDDNSPESATAIAEATETVGACVRSHVHIHLLPGDEVERDAIVGIG